MDVNEKLALADLLWTWRNSFSSDWVTADEVIHRLGNSDRDVLEQLGVKSGDGAALGRRLDEIRNKVIYNFVVKRDLPYMQPVKWRVLLQDTRVKKITNEERNDRLAKRQEAGSKIDPATAEVRQTWGNYFDPYGLGVVVDDLYSYEKLYWARSPGSDLWVEFGDLPDETRTALWALLERRSHERQRERPSVMGDCAQRPSAIKLNGGPDTITSSASG